MVAVRQCLGLFLLHGATGRVQHMSCLPCSTPAPRVSKVEPLVQWPVAKCSRQGGPDWPRHASGRLRGTQPQPAILPGCRDAADPDTCQLPRVLPQQARGPLHPLESRCQLEREFPQDQREGSGGQRAGGSEGRTAEPAAWGGAGPFQLTSAPQENEKSPSQNRKAKDATSDNGKGQESEPQTPPFTPTPCLVQPRPSLFHARCPQTAWLTRPC